MKLINLIRINIKKLREQRSKALFLIVPVLILMILTVIVSSQVKNFQEAVDQSIFGTIAEQSTLIELQKSSFENITRGGQSFSVSFQKSDFDSTYSENDLANIKNIDHVVDASLNTNVPITNISSTDLFDGVEYKINSLNELDSTSGSLYTSENFDYTEGEVIPIILSASSFIESYEDWGGQMEISLPGPGEMQQGTTPVNLSPIKTRAIDYVKEELLGKEFTLDFGGLDDIQNYTLDFSDGTPKFKKLTDDEYNSKIENRKSEISKYWNYDKLSTPQTYTFKVVGIIEDETSRNAFVPSGFADLIMKNYIQNQIDSITSEAPVESLDQTFLGTSFDGSELSTSSGTGFVRNIGKIAGGGQMAFRVDGQGGDVTNAADTTTYTIPGLVIKTNSEGEAEGIHKDANVYSTANKKSEMISIKIDSVSNRNSVVSKLNDLGYAYQDTNNFDVFEKIQSTIQTVSIGFTMAFIVLLTGVIIFAMTKFVSDSRKEIGIFRAMGMKKLSIVLMFTSQAIIYTLVAFLIGVGLGIALNTILSPVMNNSFNSFVGETIKETFNVVNIFDSSIFGRIDIKAIGIYSLVLLVITLLISLIPAFRASSISPIEAIKGE